MQFYMKYSMSSCMCLLKTVKTSQLLQNLESCLPRQHSPSSNCYQNVLGTYLHCYQNINTKILSSIAWVFFFFFLEKAIPENIVINFIYFF